MSIIGPRASEWDAVNTFLPDEIDKMKVRPGITGLSQAYYRNSVTLDCTKHLTKLESTMRRRRSVINMYMNI